MINFNEVKIKDKLSKEWILQKVSEVAIYTYYHGHFNIGKQCKSSLRHENNASCIFYIGKKGNIIYHDYKEEYNLDCFAYVQKKYGLNFFQALERIASDFGLINKTILKPIAAHINKNMVLDKQPKKEALIQVEIKDWDAKSLQFWNLYEITQQELEQNHVFNVNKIFLDKCEIYPSEENLVRYAFLLKYFKDGKEKAGIKIYNPLDKVRKNKWLCNIPIDEPFGIRDLQFKDDIVVITKSVKDLIVLKKLFTNVIATQNESQQSISPEVEEMLNKNFKKKIIIFDNDDCGKIQAEKFKERGYDSFSIPDEEYIKYKIKDCSDFILFYGIDALKQIFFINNFLK